MLLTACGGKKSVKEDAAILPKDAEIDAPQLPVCPNPVSGSTITMRKLPDNVVGAALLATSPPLDTRLFVIEQRGAIRIYKDEAIVATPFLDLSRDNGGPVQAGGEEGLLGLAFHPSYAKNGVFFIFYMTEVGGFGLRDVVARCTTSTNPDVANPTCTEVLSFVDTASNHNAGMMEFGADGFLYISTGDEGDAGDPHRNSQNPNVLFGKFLRIDVDNKVPGKEYGIPADNPFVAGGGAPEVFMLGLRNPWRWSFDRGTGDMWIGDVGQAAIEEMTVLRPSEQKGANLGWSAFEGNLCCMTVSYKCAQTGPQQPCDLVGKIFPQDSRDHGDAWIAIIAGQTYRGTCYPDIVGWHFYTDYGAAKLVKARLKPDNMLEIVDLPTSMPQNPSSIHADARGELYLTTTDGGVYRLEASP